VTTPAQRPFLDELLLRASEDWLYEQDVYALIHDRASIEEPELLRAMAMGVIRELVVQGLLTPTSFGEKSDMDPLASLDQIDEKWRQVFPHDFFAGEVVWLQLTAEGHTRAKALAEAEGWTPQWRG